MNFCSFSCSFNLIMLGFSNWIVGRIMVVSSMVVIVLLISVSEAVVASCNGQFHQGQLEKNLVYQ